MWPLCAYAFWPVTSDLQVTLFASLCFSFCWFAVTTELPAGKPLNALIGFANKGLRDFTFETVDASFRYPQDFSYSIQNFTGYRYNRLIEQNSEVSFEYAFHPHESYGGRPFGLVITATYKDDVSKHHLFFIVCCSNLQSKLKFSHYYIYFVVFV